MSVYAFPARVVAVCEARNFDRIVRVELVRRIPTPRLRLTVADGGPSFEWLSNAEVIVREIGALPISGRVTQIGDDDPSRPTVTLGNASAVPSEAARRHLAPEGFVAIVSCGHARFYPLPAP